jgi:hypothetical protein
MLAPGESRKVMIAINVPANPNDVHLGPGEYEVDFTYYAKSHQLLQGAKEELVSSVAKFTVKE